MPALTDIRKPNPHTLGTKRQKLVKNKPELLDQFMTPAEAVFPAVAYFEQHLKPREGMSILEPTSGPVVGESNITKVLTNRGHSVIENDIAIPGGNNPYP